MTLFDWLKAFLVWELLFGKPDPEPEPESEWPPDLAMCSVCEGAGGHVLGGKSWKPCSTCDGWGWI